MDDRLFLNIGILAHVDAGKTSTTERILFDTGAVTDLGSVDSGTTRTDSLEQERRRGITIKAAVTAFSLGNVHVNIVDTPGHPDFIAEVERVLDILDAAVLVVSAVEGVQAQTRLLFRALKRRNIPFLIFANKIDRMGARSESLVAEIRARLSGSVVPLGRPLNLGEKSAAYIPFDVFPEAEGSALSEILADYDLDVLRMFVEGNGTVNDEQLLRSSLERHIRAGQVHPIVYGSAISGAGIGALLDAITTLLPARKPELDAPPSGTVFKIERLGTGEKVAYVRMFEGAIRTRERVLVAGKEHRITAIELFQDGDTEAVNRLVGGQIGKVQGLTEAQIGDAVGVARPEARRSYFAPPLLETAIRAVNPVQRGRLHTALSQLAEQDPLIGLRQDSDAGVLFVSLYGEVQKEVIYETLSNEFGVEVEFSESSVIHMERVRGVGEARDEAPDPFIATIGLRIEPREPASGSAFAFEINTGTLPASFCRAVEESVWETLRQGLYGWQVIDCLVTMTDSIRHRDFANATAADHRKLTPLVIMDALKRAGTDVCEPVQHVYVECPADCIGGVVAQFVVLGGLPGDPSTQGKVSTFEGHMPAVVVQKFQQALPNLTRGEGFLEATFSHYSPLERSFPTRPRTDNNPLSRGDYLRRVK